MPSIKNFFADDKSHPVLLGELATALFGNDWFVWEPRTVYEEVVQHGFLPVSKVNAGKLHAYRVIKNTYTPWMDWEVFEKVGHALNSNCPSFEIMQPLSTGEAAVAVDILTGIKSVAFADEVLGYIAACAKLDELDYLPDCLQIAQNKLCRDMYKCLDCGNTDTDDLSDGRCDVCCGRFDYELMGGRANPEIPSDRGTNIIKFKEFDVTPVSKQFKALRNYSGDDLQLGDTSTDIQVAKLLSIEEYRKTTQNAYRSQRSQLELDRNTIRQTL